MSQRVNKNIVVAFSVICFLFLFITLFSVYNNRRFLSISKELQGTNMLMKSLSDISAGSHDASLSAEHYFITRDKDFLNDLNASKEDLSNALGATVEYSNSHLSFQKDLSALSLSTKELLNYLTRHVTGQKKQEDKMDLDVLEALNEKISTQLAAVEGIGRTHLRMLENDQQQFVIRANLFNYLVALLSIALLFVLFVFIQQLFNKRKKAEQDLISFNDALEKKVTEKTIELKHTFDRITDAFIALDANWRYTYVNKKAAELHRRTPESLLGKNIWEEFPDVVSEPFYEALHRAMRLQKPENVQLYYSKDNKWFEDFIYPSFNGLSVYYQDITEKKTIEIALQKSEQEYKSLFEQNPDAVYSLDLQGNFTSVNDSLIKLAECSEDQLLQMNFAPFVVHDELDRVKEHFLMVQKGEPQNYQVNVVSAKGTARILRVSNIPIVVDGNIVGVYGIAKDISEKVKAQEQKEFERRDKEALINTTSDLIWSVSNDIRLIAANKAFIKNIETATGITLRAGDELLMEKSFSEDFIKLWKSLYNRALSGESFTHELYTPIPENVEVSWSEISFNPIFNSEQIIGVACYARNITEAKQYQSRILDMNQRLETAQEIAKLGYWEMNTETQEVFWSKQTYAIWGESPDTHKPSLEKCLSAIHPDDVDEFNKSYNNALQSHTSLDVGMRITTPTGIIKYINCKGAFIEEESGKKIRLSGTVQDITERKQAEAELNESERKYRLLFHNNPTPMFMLAVPTFNIIDVNDSAVKHYGYTRQEFLRMNARDLRPKEEVKRYEQFATNKEIQGTRNAGHWKHKTSNGTVIDVEIITHDFNYQNQLSRIVLANDITKRLVAENELKNSHEQLRQLSSHLQTVRENERTHIAREIHDELGQQLTGLRMDATWINKKITGDQKLTNKIAGMISLIDDTVKSVRRISAELRPGILDDLGLTAALEWQTQEFEKRTGLKCRFKSLINEPVFDKDISTGIFRVYQETLTNVARHADATEVETVMERINGEIILEIKDNGQGFEVEEIKKKNTLGLIGMRERANMFGGELQLDSKPGRGTAVTLRIPIFVPEKTEA